MADASEHAAEELQGQGAAAGGSSACSSFGSSSACSSSLSSAGSICEGGGGGDDDLTDDDDHLILYDYVWTWEDDVAARRGQLAVAALRFGPGRVLRKMLESIGGSEGHKDIAWFEEEYHIVGIKTPSGWACAPVPRPMPAPMLPPL